MVRGIALLMCAYLSFGFAVVCATKHQIEAICEKTMPREHPNYSLAVTLCCMFAIIVWPSWAVNRIRHRGEKETE